MDAADLTAERPARGGIWRHWDVALTVVLSFYPLFQRLVLAPLYSVDAQSTTMSLLNRAAAIVILPGKVVVYQVAPPRFHFFTTGQMIAAIALNLIFYFLAFRGLRFVWQNRASGAPGEATPAERENEPTSAGSAAQPASALSRRQFLARATSGAVGLGGFGLASYASVIFPGGIRVRKETVDVPNLPPSLDGLTIAQITDIHHDEWISLNHVRHVVNLVNDLAPDVVALTGDYVSATAARIPPVAQALSGLRPGIGTVAVLGNHDWWTSAELTQKCFREAGLPLIDNGRVFVTARRRFSWQLPPGDEPALCIGGVGDLWEDAVLPEQAFADTSPDMPRILLSHNPDVAEHTALLNSPHRVALMLSGHTHGGQVRLPFVGTPIVPSKYGSRYVQGLVQGPACLVNVSSGIGMAGLPVRFGVPAEVVLITLQRAAVI